MKIQDEIQQLDSELEHERQELRADAEQIELKIEATRHMVSPSRIIARKPLLITGVALLAGLMFGYGARGSTKQPNRQWKQAGLQQKRVLGLP